MSIARLFGSAALLLLAIEVAGCASMAGDSGPPEAGDAQSAAAFDRMKGLAGTWTGEMSFGGEKNPARVEYRVTSGGSAVEEVLFRGTPHEMVTMYHRDGPRLMLTHYCAAQNQPTMVLLPGDDPSHLRFGFLRAANLKTPGEGHMHEAEFDLSDPAWLKASWTYWEEGKDGGAAVIDLRRAKP